MRHEQLKPIQFPNPLNHTNPDDMHTNQTLQLDENRNPVIQVTNAQQFSLNIISFNPPPSPAEVVRAQLTNKNTIYLRYLKSTYCFFVLFCFNVQVSRICMTTSPATFGASNSNPGRVASSDKQLIGPISKDSTKYSY